MNSPTVEELEQVHLEMQLGMFLSDVYQAEMCTIVTNSHVSDTFWNYATRIRAGAAGSEEAVGFIEGFLAARGRVPAFYTTPDTDPEEFTTKMLERGMSQQFRDAWLSCPVSDLRVSNVDQSSRLKIRHVSSEEDRERFVTAFMSAFGFVSEEVPYGGLPDTYAKSLWSGLTRQRKGLEQIHLLAEIDGEAVGTGSLIRVGQFAGLYNLGVVPDRRREGIGGVLAAARLREAMRLLSDGHVFFQTEADGIVERMYRARGFERRFVGVGWA